MTNMERIMMKRISIENKKEAEMEKSISIQQELMKKIAELQQQLADEQNHWQEQQKEFNNILQSYDHDLRYFMEKEGSKQEIESVSYDDSDK